MESGMADEPSQEPGIRGAMAALIVAERTKKGQILLTYEVENHPQASYAQWKPSISFPYIFVRFKFEEDNLLGVVVDGLDPLGKTHLNIPMGRWSIDYLHSSASGL